MAALSLGRLLSNLTLSVSKSVLTKTTVPAMASTNILLQKTKGNGFSTSASAWNQSFFGGNFGLPEYDYMEVQHMKGMHIKNRKNKNPLGRGVPFAKGVVLKTVIKKPKKPNSANRKCVLVKLSNGKEMTAYVPGEGHNLQEHSTVLVRVGRLRDVPGVKLKCIRGAYDLNHVVKKKQ